MEYEINSETLAVIPVNQNQTYIMEPEDEYYISGTTLEVIEHSCEYFGSSYSGRNIGTYKLLGIMHKTPIIIEESNNIIFFPTASPKSKSCMWISYGNIYNYSKGEDPKTTLVEFNTGQKMVIPISILSFSNQYLRAGRLKAVISSRKIRKS